LILTLGYFSETQVMLRMCYLKWYWYPLFKKLWKTLGEISCVCRRKLYI